MMLTVISCSQRVVISGTVYPPDSSPYIAINDTLNKFIEHADTTITLQKLQALLDDNRYATKPDVKGWFSIRPKITDSISFEASEYLPQTHAVKDLLHQKYPYVKLQKRPCDIVDCDEGINNFYAMVVQKINVTRVKPGYCGKGIIRFDNKYNATYRVVENIYNEYKNDTVQFTIFDHYGRPELENFEHILVYMTESCGSLYHVKYQFADVYKTSGGRWASPYSPHHYRNITDTLIRPEPLEFMKEISFSLEGQNKDHISARYPYPYYVIINNRAIAKYGNYVEDIFKLAKHPTLKNFGVFLKE